MACQPGPSGPSSASADGRRSAQFGAHAGAGAGRGIVNAPSMNPAVAPPQPGAQQVAPGVYRTGNSYSDSPDAALAVRNQAPSQPSAQNMAADRYVGIRSAWDGACARARQDALHIHDLLGRAGMDVHDGARPRSGLRSAGPQVAEDDRALCRRHGAAASQAGALS